MLNLKNFHQLRNSLKQLFKRAFPIFNQQPNCRGRPDSLKCHSVAQKRHEAFPTKLSFISGTLFGFILRRSLLLSLQILSFGALQRFDWVFTLRWLECSYVRLSSGESRGRSHLKWTTPPRTRKKAPSSPAASKVSPTHFAIYYSRTCFGCQAKKVFVL